VTEPEPAAFVLDLDDVSSYSIDINDDLDTEAIATMIPVRKPKKAEYVRVSPLDEYKLGVLAMEHTPEGTLDRQEYLVHPTVWTGLPDDLRTLAPKKLIRLAVNNFGVAFLWPLKIPNAGGAGAGWALSALKVAKAAETAWVRIEPVPSVGGYIYHSAAGTLAEPKWPDKTMGELIALGFADRVINSLDHPVVRALLGEV
jgi:hypothetical protein